MVAGRIVEELCKRGHDGSICNADQCGSMCDQILSIDTNVSQLRNILDQCLESVRTLIHIGRHRTLIHHVLLKIMEQNNRTDYEVALELFHTLKKEE